jgi:hypothetical protein
VDARWWWAAGGAKKLIVRFRICCQILELIFCTNGEFVNCDEYGWLSDVMSKRGRRGNSRTTLCVWPW